MKSVRSISLLESAIEIMRRAVSGFPFRNQAELARASGVSEANISRWLSGKSRPTLSTLEPVLELLEARLVVVKKHKVVPRACMGRSSLLTRRRRSARRHAVR